MQTKPNVEISIIIQGPVGAGKTTIGHLIKEALEKDRFAVVPATIEDPTEDPPEGRATRLRPLEEDLNATYRLARINAIQSRGLVVKIFETTDRYRPR